MTADNVLDGVAKDLLDAYRTGDPIAPPRETVDGLDLDGAYRIQQLQEQAFIDAGRTVVGRKIGLTSLAMQQQLGVDSPDFGFFTDDLVFADGADIEVSRFIAPKVEPELAFILGSDLAADATIEDVHAAIASTHLAVEIIDSRVRDWDIRLVDTVADNASCGAVILDRTPVDVSLEDLPKVTAEMSIGGDLAGSGTGSDVMGHPLAPLHWLAGVLGEQGVPLKAGDIVLTGSFCGATPVVAGQRVDVDYGPYGRLSATFI
ncbi:2-keto-4-pentenoate hydratase [Corynebacterium suedekumii]|uniref:Fumarylacetoacetate hydrolase family protein n=1 Tax=Corynebacterium suedekumii TaxID=3049801 RepID=A0ABY8VM62_9CORY|nr:fumarylacetoacetate hydrolase family protein [Corynebacterium suedekumii]WIM69274.1 fumarylacetoacetate hydrolase family protein [Corynebacterium suedekumii]